MKDSDVNHMLATLAESEANSTAMLVELIAATALFKLRPPAGDEVVEVEISQADITEAMAGYFYQASYGEDGVMRLRLSLNRDCVILAHDSEPSEVTSES